MYLKVNQGSLLYSKLFAALATEGLRNINFQKWMAENLPEFNDDVMTLRLPWYTFAEVVAWKFTGKVDKKVWKLVKGWPGYYEPNRRTKEGKSMRERIWKARGNRLNRKEFLDIFGISMPVGSQFTLPDGFAYDGICYMVFDDANYKDITTKLAGQFEEITLEEIKTAMIAYNEANKKLFEKLSKTE